MDLQQLIDQLYKNKINEAQFIRDARRIADNKTISNILTVYRQHVSMPAFGQTKNVEVQPEKELESSQEEQPIYVEEKVEIDSLVNISAIRFVAEKILKLKNLRSIEPKACEIIGLALYHRLKDLLEQMLTSAYLRADTAKNNFATRPVNDPKKQMWVIERELSDAKGGDSDEEGDDRQRRNRYERDDLLIKQRLSANAALDALGVTQKSWMKTVSYGSKKDEDKSNFISPFAPNLEIVDYRQQEIGRAELIYVLETDKKFSKSHALLAQYTDYNQS